MNTWLHDNLYNILTTLLGGGSLFAFITERRKRKIQEQKDLSSAKQEEANALETIQSVYDKFVKDSLERYLDLTKQIDEIKKELENVYAELESVTSELNEEKRKSAILKSTYETLKRTCEALNKKLN